MERFVWEVVDIDRSHAWECKTIPRTHGFHSVQSFDNPIFEFGPENLLAFSLVVMVIGMGVNHWIGLMDGITYHLHLINVQLLI